MLPEKRRQIIIAGIALVALIIVIIGIASLTKYIKKRATEGTKSDDAYPSKYAYIGIRPDEDGANQVYGIDKNFEETYLGVRTFYDIRDIKIINNHLVLFSDATNELRYDASLNEFYFYEIDSFYSNSIDIRLASNYLVFITSSRIYYRPYGTENKNNTDITNNSNNIDILVNKNIVYYILSDGIHKYDLESKEDSLAVAAGVTKELTLLEVNDNYLLFFSNDVLMSYNINNKATKELNDNLYLDEEANISYLGLEDTNMLLLVQEQENYKIKKFSLSSNKYLDYSYDLKDEFVLSLINLQNGYYYMYLSNEEINRSVIVDLDKQKIISELEDAYLYLTSVGE